MMDPIVQVAYWSTLVQEQAIQHIDGSLRQWENVFISEYPRRQHD
jgi:hypothetical protein